MQDTEISDELRVLAKQADLDLPEPYLAELAGAWAHVARMVKRVRGNRPYSAEPAHVFDMVAIIEQDENHD